MKIGVDPQKKIFVIILFSFSFMRMINIKIRRKVKINGRPKVSIIVPVYNVKKWLPECLDSLINQTLEDIEIICIDDGSTDSSGEILEDYSKKDEERMKKKNNYKKTKNKKGIIEEEIKGRIKVIHQKKLGVSAARNAGLGIASGEYITFVDSDDYVHPECYKTAYKWARKDNIDIIQFGHNKIYNESQKKIIDISEKDKSDSKVLNLENFLKKIKNEYVWFKMIKSNIIKDNNIRFITDISICEDKCFSFMVFPRATRFKIIPGKFYNYRSRPGSTVKTFDHNDYINRQKKIIINQVYNSWKGGNLIKGREHIFLEFIFCSVVVKDINRVDDILKIVEKLNSPKVLLKCSKKCKDAIQEMKKQTTEI